MPVLLTLRCKYCGMRMEADLAEADTRALLLEGAVVKLCRNCQGMSPFEVVREQIHETAPATEANRMDGGTSDEEPPQPRILMIDDDDSILTILRKALERENFEVETATSARDAIMRLTRSDYNLIISDIRMPGFDGKQLFDFLDQHFPEYKSRVIFLTGDLGNPSTQDFLTAAGAPYLSKPLEIPKLLQLVREALRG